MDDKEQLEIYRKMATEFGRKGGRPREVIHSDEPGCRCATCRKKKAGTGKRGAKK